MLMVDKEERFSREIQTSVYASSILHIHASEEKDRNLIISDHGPLLSHRQISIF